MTRQSIHEKGTPFSEWLRQLSKPLDSSVISNHNLDFIWHNYKQNWLILIEEKRWGANQTFSQRSTHSVVDQMLQFASDNGCKVKDAYNRLVRIDYRGYYLVKFEKTTPDDSKWIVINGTKCGKPELMQLLSTGKFTKTGLPAFLEMRNFT